MKKVNVTISYDAEKLHALRMYLNQKNQTLEQELTASVDTLYAKAVPSGVRDFIEMRSGAVNPTEKKKKLKAPVSVAPPQERGGNA